MSIASLGIVGGLATSGLAQRTAETDRLPSDANDHSRAFDAAQQAEQAAGIGHAEGDSEATDRDADGRRPWELNSRPQPTAAKAGPAENPTSALSKDPTGQRGNELDLSG
jgi:hypothetical protein